MCRAEQKYFKFTEMNSVYSAMRSSTAKTVSPLELSKLRNANKEIYLQIRTLLTARADDTK